MKALTTVAGLSEAISKATRSAKFCVTGSLPVVDPCIDVEGLGTIKFPLRPAVVKKLISQCRIAPYGKGTETVVDTAVRKTFELGPTKFRLSQEWNSAVAQAAQVAADELGVPGQRIEVELYKLLVYEKGGFFLPHRDSEKHDGMVASLVVVLANPFEGGTLVVRHGVAEETLRFEQAAKGQAPCFAAFYADCEHEVQRVTHGVRLCLTYNLVLTNREQPPRVRKKSTPADVLTESIRSWTMKQPVEPLVFALEHQYTQRGLALELLKGADRQLAELVLPAASSADCMVSLAQVSRHLMQFADDGSFARGYSRRYGGYEPRGAIEIGETYDDEIQGREWTDLHGKKQPWGPIALDLSAIVSSVPVDDWKPTSEEFEGYTGNAGNTLDRWYHRSALVLWHRDHHFDVIASCGAAVSIPLLASMTAKLAKTPKRRLEEVLANCRRFAGAIVAQWPRSTIGYWRGERREKTPSEDFPALLLMLHDRDLIAQFLSKVAERDQTAQLADLIVIACREFGWTAFAEQLKQLLTVPPDEKSRHGRQDILPRDLGWLSAFCLDESADPDKSALADELCRLAVERFCVPFPPQPPWHRPDERREKSVSESSLPLLLNALAASGRDDDLARVIHFVESSPNEFSLDACQVPALKSLLPWSRKRWGENHPQLMAWLASVRRKLELATANEPAPPADWARPAEVACSCQYCARLNAFLADAGNEVARIPAREDMRQHLIGMIGRHQCDVKHALERQGSPYSLVLTKTTGSFKRATKRYKENCRLLEIIRELDGEIVPQKQQSGSPTCRTFTRSPVTSRHACTTRGSIRSRRRKCTSPGGCATARCSGR